MYKKLFAAIALSIALFLNLAPQAHAAPPPVVGMVADDCSAEAWVDWPIEGKYVLGALVDPEGADEVSYDELSGTKSLRLRMEAPAGYTSTITFEAVNSATGEVVWTGKAQASCRVDVYITPGYHHVNDREWRTTCEPYSQTERCRTEIKATQVTQVDGKFVSKNGWVFNNLTYKASPRSLYAGNPLGNLGGWTSADGRQWNTDCDSAATGRNGCRSYILARVIVADTPEPGASWTYHWETKWVMNNMVRFS